MELTEVRLLGALRVRRADGSYVETAEWRTAMTRGLLALLALSAPHPIPASRALETIWPNVDPARSRARLRMAASQIRKAIGTDCIEREGDGLLLVNVWVDTAAFETLVGQARREFILGRPEEGVRTARNALGLFAGELFDDAASADWIIPRREHYRRLHQDLLLEMAEAALQAGWHRDAVIAANRVARAHPADERAARVLMQGYHQLGETEQSLLAFQRCRSSLSEAVGADPSPETDLLHRSLLVRPTLHQALPAFVGRSQVVAEVRAAAQDAFAKERARIVHLVGPPLSGKSRLLDELGTELDARTVLVRMGVDAAGAGGALVARIAEGVGTTVDGPGFLNVDQPTLVCVDDFQWVDAAAHDTLSRVLRNVDAPLLVVTAGTGLGLHKRPDEDVHRLRSLTEPEVASLLADVFGGPVAEETVQSFRDSGGGLPGALIEAAVHMRDQGLLHSAEDGLVRVSATSQLNVQESPAARVEAARALLPTAALDLLDLLAVLDEPIDVASLMAVGVSASEIPWLDLLNDAGLLRVDSTAYTFAAPELRDAAYTWLRPSVRRRLHRRFAGAPAEVLSHGTRLHHWLAAGSFQEQLLPVIEPSVVTKGDDLLLKLSVPLTALRATESVTDGLGLLTGIMTAAHRSQDHATAEHASSMAIDWATESRPESLPELYRRRAALSLADEDSLSWCTKAREVVNPADLVERSNIEIVAGSVLARWSQPLAREALEDAVRLADTSGDPGLQVVARAALVDQLIPGRQVQAARDVAKAAADAADRSKDPLHLALALASIAQAGLRTGSSIGSVRTLERAWPLSRGDAVIHGQVACDLAWAQHEFGFPGVGDSLDLARRMCEGTPMEARWHLTASRIALETGRLALCADHVGQAIASSGSPVVMYIRAHLVRGRLHAASGNVGAAAADLEHACDVTVNSGSMFMLGEVTARLAAVIAESDPEAAEARLRRATMVIGQAAFPRERVVMLLARGVVAMARHNDEVAMVLAKAANTIARKAGLVQLVEETDAYIARVSDRTVSASVIDLPAVDRSHVL